MKIEKINENQIRCTLQRKTWNCTRSVSANLPTEQKRQKKLFRDMMQQAQIQFGFEADNIPLMIEAIPVNVDSIILIITKVEDPEELDTRFSKFTPYKDRGQTDSVQLDGADNIIDIFQKLCEAKIKEASQKASAPADEPASSPEVSIIRLYTFSHLDDVIDASHGLNGFFTGENTLYKESHNGRYQLVLHQSQCTPEAFNKVCNILSDTEKEGPLLLQGKLI